MSGFCTLPLHELSKVAQSDRIRKWKSGCHGLEEGGYKELLFNEHRVLILQGKEFCGDRLHNTVNTHNTTELNT